MAAKFNSIEQPSRRLPLAVKYEKITFSAASSKNLNTRIDMLPELWKVVTPDEDIYLEGERAAYPPLRLFGGTAVVANFWVGQGYVEDLSRDISRVTPILGKLLKERLIAVCRSGEAIEAYGKVSIAGLK